MPSRRILRSAIASLLVAATALVAQTATAQTSPSMVGLANVSLGAGIGPFPSGTAWSASAEYLPFVTNHLQVGAGFSYGGSNGPYGAETGGLSASARYLFGANPRSAPYVSASLSESGGQRRPGIGTGDAAIGWLHFLTPLTAIDAHLFVSGSSVQHSKAFTGLAAGPSVFLDGWRSSATAAAQKPWAFDWNGSLSANFAPTTEYGAGAQYAPFLTRFLQVGVGGGFSEIPSQHAVVGASHSYNGNAMVRLYVPTGGFLRPFLEGYGSAVQSKAGPASSRMNVHGASLGVRHYFSDELALDARVLRETQDNIGETFIGAPPVSVRVTLHHTQTRFSLGLVVHQPGH
jgi:hypothetical protein